MIPSRAIRGASRATIIIEIAIIALALAIGLTIRTAAQMAVIESSSMEPTLHKDDRTIVDKRPQTIASLHRGDVIVFRWNDKDGATYVKRIVGLPGQAVIVARGQVFINGAPLNEPYLKEPAQRERPYGATVGADEYFVLGDNRNKSEDSRERGCVARRNIIGRVTSVVWPRSHSRAVN